MYGSVAFNSVSTSRGHPRLSVAGGGALVLVNWALTLGKEVFSPYETLFLKNFLILQDMFYREFVVGLILDFNKACGNSIETLSKEYEKELRLLQAKLLALPETKQLS